MQSLMEQGVVDALISRGDDVCPYLFWRQLSPSMRDDSLLVEIQNRMSWVRSFHVFTPYPVHSFVHRVCDLQEMPCVHHIVSCKVSSRQPSARTHVWSAAGSFSCIIPCRLSWRDADVLVILRGRHRSSRFQCSDRNLSKIRPNKGLSFADLCRNQHGTSSKKRQSLHYICITCRTVKQAMRSSSDIRSLHHISIACCYLLCHQSFT